MSRRRTLAVAWKALVELGPAKLGLYALYQLGLRSRYLAWRTPIHTSQAAPSADQTITQIFEPCLAGIETTISAEEKQALILEASEIIHGQVRLFGGLPVSLNLGSAELMAHWSAYELGQASFGDEVDIKLVWEPARFSWACVLARAYALTHEDVYPEAFWQRLEVFCQGNPPNQGPHWMSAQEVALRLISFIFAGQVFGGAPASTPARKAMLRAAIADHARRIPPTLIYARSQNNNHLLSEAAGLYSAGCALPDLPESASWRRLGWKWVNQALQSQIDADGVYIQQSTNYHRLMLQLALWINAIHGPGKPAAFPELTCQRLAAAAQWLINLVDPETGLVPNLGANDGAYLMPLSSGGFSDFRPVAQASARAFLGQPAFPPGPWDELGLWYSQPAEKKPLLTLPHGQAASLIGLAQPASYPMTRAYLRAAQFHDRPSHADQLAVDIWWRGINVALDPGTYQNNAPAPWDNGLARTAVHNTVQVDGKDQMTRAGRFLWLDWAQASIIQTQSDASGGRYSVSAEHNGYRKAGITHRRELKADGAGGWLVTDRLVESEGRTSNTERTIRLHWLMPDWPWELHGLILALNSPHGWINLAIQDDSQAMNPGLAHTSSPLSIYLIRAGEVLYGPSSGPPDTISPAWDTMVGENPTLATLGWYSPNYSQKVPALSLSVIKKGRLPLSLTSQWTFPQRYSRNP